MLPIIGVLAPIISKVLDFIPDPNKKAEAQLKIQQELDANSQAILKALSEIDKGQLEVNKQEAASSSLFIAGWRPFLGWVCGVAFAWQYVGLPISIFVLKIFGKSIELPQFDFGTMAPILTGMLGLAGMRTWEKSQGAQNNH